MANAADNLIREPIGPEGIQFDLPVKAAKHLYEGTLITQLTADGYAVAYSTASSGVCVGVAQHESDNTAAGAADGDKRIVVETKRMHAFDNGTAGDAFADTDKIGSLVYGTDDHTAAKTSSSQTRQPVGFFYGFESDGKVRVFIDPALARVVAAFQALADAPATADALRDAIVAAFG